MSDSIDERAPLLQFPGAWPPTSSTINLPASSSTIDLSTSYRQFCHLIGNQPMDWPKDKSYSPPRESLYGRALRHRKMQGYTYAFTAALTNTLLLSQVVLGAALTGLGASGSSHILITVFGALNTVIAGLVAFLKSRGQPMRARMFRDDLDRVVDEIENSATMWLGISSGIHGYDAIDTEDAVTVRSEVARLTRLYDRAVKLNTINDPDFYGTGSSGDPHSAILKAHVTPTAATVPVPNVVPAVDGATQTPAAVVPVAAAPVQDPDESPATKAKVDSPKIEGKDKDKAPAASADDVKPAPAPAPAPTDDKTATTAPTPAPADSSASTPAPAAPAPSTDTPAAPADASTPAPASTASAPAPVPTLEDDEDASPATARNVKKHDHDHDHADSAHDPSKSSSATNGDPADARDVPVPAGSGGGGGGSASSSAGEGKGAS